MRFGTKTIVILTNYYTGLAGAPTGTGIRARTHVYIQGPSQYTCTGAPTTQTSAFDFKIPSLSLSGGSYRTGIRISTGSIVVKLMILH